MRGVAGSLLVVVVVVVACVALGVMCGCAGVGMQSGMTTPAVGTAADMRGGWLVAGTLPGLNNVGSAAPTPFGLSMTLDVIAGQITGTASILVPCATNGTSLGAIGGSTRIMAPATVAADGSFVLEDVLAAGATTPQFVVNGQLPPTVGGMWSGTYTAGGENGTCNGVPPPTVSGSFTTQKMQPVSGTFTGVSTLSGSSATVTVAATLSQGGPASLNVQGASVTSVNAISGTVQVTGSPCFRSGSIQNNHGAIFGNRVEVEFVMDDGSTVLISGSVTDLAASQLSAASLLVVGGACNNAFGFVDSSLFTK